jgi:type IV pilus assembly protein PilC
MATYSYEAVDSQGAEQKGEVEAGSDKEAMEKVREQGLYVTRVDAKSGGRGGGAIGAPQAGSRKKAGFSINVGGVGMKALTQFTRQFATLLDAGLPIVRSLDILYNQQRVGLLKETLGEVKSDVESGSSLSDALTKHPRAFDKLYVNMVRAGEAGGVLDQILARLADYLEKALRLRHKIIGALVYPIAVITIAFTILALIMIFIIPRFEQMFKDMELGEMPMMTQVMLFAARTARDFWWLVIIFLFLLWAALYFVGRTAKGRYTIDMIKLKLPIFGMIISKSSISRFCRTLGTLIQSGVPILNALSIIKGATGNAVIASAVDSVHNSIREGDTIAEPLRHCGVFDDLVVNMIQVGEETGELDKMLIKVADTYENEVDTLVGGLMSLLEPLMIVSMGVMVGFIVIALFLPLLSMIEKMSSGGAR